MFVVIFFLVIFSLHYLVYRTFSRFVKEKIKDSKLLKGLSSYPFILFNLPFIYILLNRQGTGSLPDWIIQQINSIPEQQRVLITSHDAFRYFGKAYGVEVNGLQGISTEAKVRTEDVKNLIDFIKAKNLKSVFIETSVNPKLLEQISSETGATVGGTLFSDSIGNEGTPEGTYIGAVKHNVNSIVKALK